MPPLNKLVSQEHLDGIRLLAEEHTSKDVGGERRISLGEFVGLCVCADVELAFVMSFHLIGLSHWFLQPFILFVSPCYCASPCCPSLGGGGGVSLHVIGGGGGGGGGHCTLLGGHCPLFGGGGGVIAHYWGVIAHYWGVIAQLLGGH